MTGPDVILELQDLRYLEWSRIRQSSGTAGSYLKAFETVQRKKVYYKLSCYDSVQGITGYESVNELIADRLLAILGIGHLRYQLIHALVSVEGKEFDTYICASEDFKEPGDSKIALDDFYALEKHPDETILAFCDRMNWSQYIYEMLIIDYLILNRDRHGANIEILRNRHSGAIRPAPLFDHGLSLLYSCHSEKEAEQFDVLADLPVQSLVGSRSAEKNLELIPKAKQPRLRKLEERDRVLLFSDLEQVLPNIYKDKIWEMIWLRWKTYESMCHSR